jgi:SPX domain protein involved in polyphosphate accumulation
LERVKVGDFLKVRRKEIKYPINRFDYIELQSRLNNLLPRDDNSLKQGYLIRSLYFDSINNMDYLEKMNGAEKRKKIRLRIYSTDQQKVKLEIKKKLNDYQVKETIMISREDALELIDKNYEILMKYNDETALEIYEIMTRGQYRPIVLIDYERVAYVHHTNNIRITLDSNIRSSETNFDMFNPKLVLRPIFLNDTSVLEVKFNDFLYSWIKNGLNIRDGYHGSFSKYCQSRVFFENYIL